MACTLEGKNEGLAGANETNKIETGEMEFELVVMNPKSFIRKFLILKYQNTLSD